MEQTMNHKALRASFRFVALIVLVTSLISCSPQSITETPAPIAQVTPSISNIRVNDAVPEEAPIQGNTEEFPLPNCGGTGELRQTLGTHVSVSKSVEVGVKATVTGGGEVAIPETAKLELTIAVEGAYKNTLDSANSRLDTIEMSAAAGTQVVYVIKWYEQVFNSTVQYSEDSKVYEAPYTYKLRIPKIDGSYSTTCPGNSSGGNEPTAIPLPQPTSQLTPRPSGLRWEQEVGQVPSSGTKLKWELLAGQLLFLSGGQLRVNGEYCGGDAEQICVVIYTANTAQTVIADALIPENNYYGISATLSPEEALSEKEPQFWYQPNCIDGCRKATILFFTDGQLVNKTTLTP